MINLTVAVADQVADHTQDVPDASREVASLTPRSIRLNLTTVKSFSASIHGVSDIKTHSARLNQRLVHAFSGP